MQAVSDEQLIEWVANGDASCLGTLFERYHTSVYQFCLRMTRNPGYAEDVTQEVFLRVLKKAGSFRHEGTFKGWLFNIARNITLDYLRKQKRQAAQYQWTSTRSHGWSIIIRLNRPRPVQSRSVRWRKPSHLCPCITRR